MEVANEFSKTLNKLNPIYKKTMTMVLKWQDIKKSLRKPV